VKWLRQHHELGAILVVAMVGQETEGGFSVELSVPGMAATRTAGTVYASRETAFDAADALVRVVHGHSCGPICAGWIEDAPQRRRFMTPLNV
jgi:hypothetical protein